MEANRHRSPRRPSAPAAKHRTCVITPVDQRQLKRSVECIDTIDEFLSTLQYQITETPAVPAVEHCPAADPSAPHVPTEAEQAAQNHARLGVDCIVLRALGKRRVAVTIGKFPEFTVGRAVAETLRALAANPGAATTSDGLVPWKPYEELAWSIQARTGRRPSIYVLSNNICRLRRALVRGDSNKYLVQTDRREQVARFALTSMGRIIDGDEPA